ncbi:tyrosine-type recombinase/integrase [Geomonas azotofigens]|uniref:tyrosine-type recombinase/integrase n=1 Tax=Geomonas azotofigens TaxID=2843196 RepID=UPI001C1009E8|nr:site-specific integrase [Geomonas azotofigens]MBU5613522.1 integrase arm-type DNA-binding domain-containing protein [Geomonas azotofigens]
MARTKSTMFTDTMIRKLKPEEVKYTRSEGNGFTVRVLPSGAKVWLYLYRLNEKRWELNLGTYPQLSLEEAREQFEAARKKVKGGVNPAAEPEEVTEEVPEERRRDLTFDELAREYIANNVEGQLVESSVYGIKRILLTTGKKGTLDDFKTWRSRKVASITTEEAAKLVKDVSARSAAAARNLIRAARPMFSYALAREMVKTNPFILGSVKSFLSKPVQVRLVPGVRSRTFSEDEIRHFWKELSRATGGVEARNALRLILLTGQRPGEVLGLHSDEIEGNWWTLPKERTKARYDKNRMDHRVFLVPEALALIGDKKGYIFESRVKNRGGGESELRPISTNALGHLVLVNKYLGLPPWGPHDLRRTCRTYMSDIDGISASAAEAILNHAREGTKKNYDHHRYLRQIETALTLWRDKLVEVIGGSLVPGLPDNVIPIRRKEAVAE